MKTLMLSALLCLLPFNALAAGVPAHGCKKPKLLNRMDSGDMGERKRFDRDFDAYKKCMTQYVNHNGEMAQAHQKAAKQAIDEINAFVAKVNAS